MSISTAFDKATNKTIYNIEGLEKGSETLTIIFTDGSRLHFYHDRLCCEQVYISDFEITAKNIDKFKGAILLEIYETSNKAKPEEVYASGTWTFYNINTSKGSINLRWLGESNGYYSESVDVEYKE